MPERRADVQGPDGEQQPPEPDVAIAIEDRGIDVLVEEARQLVDALGDPSTAGHTYTAWDRSRRNVWNLFID